MDLDSIKIDIDYFLISCNCNKLLFSSNEVNSIYVECKELQIVKAFIVCNDETTDYGINTTEENVILDMRGLEHLAGSKIRCKGCFKIIGYKILTVCPSTRFLSGAFIFSSADLQFLKINDNETIYFNFLDFICTSNFNDCLSKSNEHLKLGEKHQNEFLDICTEYTNTIQNLRSFILKVNDVILALDSNKEYK